MENIYKTMYLRMFNGISDITRHMEESGVILPDYLKIMDMLKQLQIKTEDAYMSAGDKG